MLDCETWRVQVIATLITPRGRPCSYVSQHTRSRAMIRSDGHGSSSFRSLSSKRQLDQVDRHTHPDTQLRGPARERTFARATPDVGDVPAGLIRVSGVHAQDNPGPAAPSASADASHVSPVGLSGSERFGLIRRSNRKGRSLRDDSARCCREGVFGADTRVIARADLSHAPL
jgi:hypothetical protein